MVRDGNVISEYTFLNGGARAADQGIRARRSSRLRHGAVLAAGVRRNAVRPAIAEADLFRSKCPHADLIIFERSAIAPHEEEWVRFNQIALEFFQATAK